MPLGELKTGIFSLEARLFNVLLTGVESQWPLVSPASLFCRLQPAYYTDLKHPETALYMQTGKTDHLAVSPFPTHHLFQFFHQPWTLLITSEEVFGKKSLRERRRQCNNHSYTKAEKEA